MAGNLNRDWLNTVAVNFKSFCDSINLTQLVQMPSRPNTKNLDKPTLIDLILTNDPHKFSTLGVFCNDLSDHCVVAAVRDPKIPKYKLHIIVNRSLKHFND